MAEYQVVIVSPQGETWDVTERVSTLTWSGSIKRVSRSGEAVMATPNDGSLPELPCELGNELRLWCGGRTRFRGNIVTREKATEGVATTWPTTRDGTPSGARPKRRPCGPSAGTLASRSAAWRPPGRW